MIEYSVKKNMFIFKVNASHALSIVNTFIVFDLLNLVIILYVPCQVVFIGMMLSSSLWGNISDKYGRKVVCLV